MDKPPDLRRFSEIADIRVVNSADQLNSSAPDADALFIWDYRFADLATILGRADRLRWIHVASVGVDPVLSPELRASSIVLTNSRGVFDIAIAEYVTLLVLADAKDFRQTLAVQARSEWSHRLTRRLTGSSAVVVGTGSIGRAIAAMLMKLSIEITLVGRVAAQDPQFGDIRASHDLAAVATGTDYLVLAAPLTDGTRHLVGRDVLTALGPDGYLINVGRGGLIDTAALIDALSNGGLRGAAVDTFDVEPLPPDSCLWKLPNVVVSPHMSGDFAGFEDALLDAFGQNLDRFIRDEQLLNVIDFERGYVASP